MKLDNKLPGSVQQRIQGYHSATNEILRHFWSSYEPYKPDKNNRMIEGLRRQQERLKEILISVVSYDGDPERCKQVETYKHIYFNFTHIPSDACSSYDCYKQSFRGIKETCTKKTIIHESCAHIQK